MIYLDETMFTRKTTTKTEWARHKENMTVDQARLDEPTLALLLGISKEKGVEFYQIFEFSVNTEKYAEWLAGLKQVTGEDKVCLFMDNLGAHKCKPSKRAMKRHGFRWVFNVPYSPQWNPIELVFSQLKAKFKALRARKMLGLSQDSHERLIEKAVESLKKQNIVKCVNHVHKLLN